MSAIVGSFRQSAAALNTLLENNQSELDSSISNIHNITSNFSKLSDSIATAGLSRTMMNLDSTVQNLDRLLSRIESGEGSLGKLVHNEDLYNNLSEASRELDLLLQDFRLNPKRYVNVSVFGKKQKEYTLPDEDPASNPDNE